MVPSFAPGTKPRSLSQHGSKQFQTILVNNCSPHPSILGTLHGLAQSCTSLARTVGPMLCGYIYGVGLAKGVVGAVFWGLSGFALLGWLTSWLVVEGDGHEIILEGDEVSSVKEQEDVSLRV